MKLRRLLYILPLLAVLTLGAQTQTPTARRVAVPKGEDSNLGYKVRKPDLEEIKRETLNPHSKYYYRTLYDRYSKNDTSYMSPEDFRYLYLGYMFQEDYDPYRVSPYSEACDSLREKSTHTAAEIDTIQHYAQLALKDNPFDLRQMSFLIHVLKENKKFATAKIWEYRLENILRAIKSTGTGEDVENAWYVVYPTHEYDLIQLLGFKATAVDFPVEGVIDQLIVEPQEGLKRKTPPNGYFFNVKIPTEQYELKYPEPENNDNNENYDTYQTTTD